MVLHCLHLVSSDNFFYIFQGSAFLLNVFSIISAKALSLLVLVGFFVHFFSKPLCYYPLNYINTQGNNFKVYNIFCTKKNK